MKNIIPFIVGIIVFCFGFWLDSQFINWVTSDITGNFKFIMKIVLWIVTFNFTLWVSIILGLFVGSLTEALISDYQYKQRRKSKFKK